MALAGAICAAQIASITQSAYAASPIALTQITTHPRASQLLDTPFQGGAALKSIAIHDGKLYAGYGDWYNNSDSAGPSAGRTAVLPFDLSSGTWETANEIFTGSEANDTIRALNGHLYLPTTDPSSFGIGGYATNDSGVWQNHFSLPEATHVFDIASPRTNELWLFGSMANPAGGGMAAAWRSLDNGTTWQMVKQDGSDPPTSGAGYEGYYWGASLNHKVFMQARDINPQTPFHRFDIDTGQWSTIPESNGRCFGYISSVVVFMNKVVCSSGLIGEHLETVAFDENGVFTSTHLPMPRTTHAKSIFTDQTNLYTLDGNNVLYRTNDLTNWSSAPLPPTIPISSFTVNDGKLYAGDQMARIYESPPIDDFFTPIIPLTGSESCFQFDTQSKTITDYYEHEQNTASNPPCSRDVTIPSTIGGIPVTTIGYRAFQNKQITGITLPPTLRSIGVYGFSDNHLSSLTIPEGITDIGDVAFEGNQLKSLIVPASLASDPAIFIGTQAEPAALDIWRRNLAYVSPDERAAFLAASWYVKVYTGDPSNPRGFTDGAYVVRSNDGESVTVSGVLINPAAVSFRFLNAAGGELKASLSYVGMRGSVPIGDYILQNSPTLPAPMYPYSPTADEKAAIEQALQAYLHHGDTITNTAPVIDNILASPSHYSFAVSASENNQKTYTYRNSFSLRSLPSSAQGATHKAITGATLDITDGRCRTLRPERIRTLPVTLRPTDKRITMFGGIDFQIDCVPPIRGKAMIIVTLGEAYQYPLKLRAYKIKNGALASMADKVQFRTNVKDGKMITTLSYSVTDGGMLDDDGSANNSIRDPIYIGTYPNTTVLANTGEPLTVATGTGIVLGSLSLLLAGITLRQ